MTPTSSGPRARTAALTAVLLLALAPAARAQSYTWNRDANDSWNVAGNWNPAVVPSGQGVAVVFGGVITADRTVTLDSPVSVGSLTFQSTARSYTLGGSSTLALDNGASAAVISMAASATVNQNIATSLSALSDVTVTNSNSSATLALSGTLTLGGHNLTLNGSGAVGLGTLTGSGNLTVAGSGVTTLTSSASDFTGTVMLNSSGVLAISADTQLGAAANALAFNGGTLRVTGAAPVSTSRSITLPNSGTIDVQNTEAVSGFTIQSAIASGLGFTKTGSGILTLSGANTFGGGVAVQAGTLRVTGAGVLSPNASLGITAGATVQLNGFNQSITFLSSTNSTSINPSNLDLGSTPGMVLTIGRQGLFDMTGAFTGKITGTGDLVKTGLGTQQIGSPVDPISTFTGNTTVRQGVLELTSYVPTSGPGPLGSSTGAVKLGDAAFGALNAALLNRDTTFGGFARPIDVQAGTGYRTIGHPLSGTSYIGYTVTYSGGINLGNDLRLYSPTDLNGKGATLAVGGAVAGSGGLVKIGAGEAQLLANNTYTGPTTVLNGQLTLAGASGAAASSSGFVLRTDGSDVTGLNFSQAGISLIQTAQLALYDFTPNPNRIGNVDVTLQQGQFTYSGRSGGASAQSFHNLVVDRGPNTLMLTTGDTNATTSATLTMTGGLVRNNNGTLLVVAAALGNPDGQNFTRVLAANAPALLGGGGGANATNISIIPWAYHDTDPNGTLNPSTETFLTYSPGVGLRPLGTNEFVTGLAGAANGHLDNVRITATSDSISSDLTINALRYGTTLDGTITLNNGAKLTVNSGAILSTASTPTGKLTITGGELAFGTAEGVIHTVVGSSVTINGVISGTGGLTSNLGVNGTLALNGANTYTGPTTVNGGSVTYTSAASFGSGGDPIRFRNNLNGGMGYTGTGATVLPNPIEIGQGTTSISVNNGGTLTLNGVISGTAGGNPGGPVFAANSGVIQIRGANTFTGLTQVTTGTVGILANNSFGDPSNQLNLGSGTTGNPTLRFDAAAIDLARPVVIQGNVTINTNGNDGTISGQVFGSSTAYTLTKSGAGTLTLTGPGTYVGPTTVSGGTLRVNGTLTNTSTQPVTVANGGTLGGSGTVDRPVTVNSGGTLAPGAGVGTLTVRSLAYAASASASYEWEAGATAQDQVVATVGSLNLTGIQMTLKLYDRGLGTNVSPSQRFPLVTVPGTGTITGFDPANFTAVFAGAPNWVAGQYAVGVTASGGNSVLYLTGLTPVPVPEPAGLLAVAAAGLAAVTYRRRRRRDGHFSNQP
jgi:autotransporter-associated beta strand protein